MSAAPTQPKARLASASRIAGATAVLAAGATAAMAVARRRRTGPVAHRRPAARQMRLASLGTKAGTGYAVHRARRVFAAAERRDELDRRFEINTAEQVAQTLGDMKGLLMKVGQMARFMSDDLPEAFRAA